MTVFEAASLATAIIAGLGFPAVGFILKRQDQHRTERFGAMIDGLNAVHDKIDHIDKCVDDLKERVLGNTVSPATLETHKAEMRAALAEQRGQISNDTNGLHQRIFRLEDRALTRETRPNGV